MDYSTLDRLPTELIDEHLRRRYPDMVWRARTTNGKTDLVLLIEFQGRPERRMALRTTVYNILTVRELLEHDKELDRADRDLALVSLVLHHGDRPWNAPTRLRDLFQDSAPDTYRVVSRRPRKAPPPTPLDLPQMVLGLPGVSTAEAMKTELPVLRRVVEDCDDEDFDRFMARAVTAMLLSKGFSGAQLEEAMNMGTVVTEFQRSLDDIRWQGQVRLLRQMAARKFGPEIAEELSRLLTRTPDPEHIDQVATAILECDKAGDLLERARGG